jgi:aminoglycoside phosphotransferase (APT) family kinase protein
VAEPDLSIRRFPKVAVTSDQLAALLSPLRNGQSLAAIQHIDGGLTNTILRVSSAGFPSDVVVRIYPGGTERWEKERQLLMRFHSELPSPRVLLADDGHGALAYPSLVYEWIEGVTLNAMRRIASSEEVLSLAAPLGRVLAEISELASEASVNFQALGPPPTSSREEVLTVTQRQLLGGRARRRLGASTSDALWAHLSREAGALGPIGKASCLVHGDLGGRNILVAPERGERWRIAAVVDWEDAFTGWAMWDVGSLFRYPGRYGQAFQDQFESGYNSRGDSLPGDWRRIAAFLDATRQVATLDSERELPAAFADCCQLLETLLQPVA